VTIHIPTSDWLLDFPYSLSSFVLGCLAGQSHHEMQEFLPASELGLEVVNRIPVFRPLIYHEPIFSGDDP
jgi:hypothetical protein